LALAETNISLANTAGIIIEAMPSFCNRSEKQPGRKVIRMTIAFCKAVRLCELQKFLIFVNIMQYKRLQTLTGFSVAPAGRASTPIDKDLLNGNSDDANRN
jgi:hypothetical protein